MGRRNQQSTEITEFKENLIGDLTINEALILIAVCAAKERSVIDENLNDEAGRIATLARNHPVFTGLEDSIEPSINKFMNIIDTTTDLVKPASTAANVLDSRFKETAFGWFAEIIMPDGVLTQERKNILDKYALLLNIPQNDARQTIVKVSNQSPSIESFKRPDPMGTQGGAMNKRDQYVEQLKMEIDRINSELERLEDKVQQTTAIGRSRAQNLLDELRHRRRELEERMVDVSVAGENAWEELKKGADLTWQTMKDTLQRVQAEFQAGIDDSPK